jgi:hypothetical protein
VKKHPSIKQSDWSRTIPLGLHGDGGAFSHHDSLYAFSWNSLLGVGNTIRKRFLFTVIRKTDVGPDTLDAIFKLLAWSFNIMLTGNTPYRDWEDRPLNDGGNVLAGGFKASLCQIRGDWEFYTQVFKFPYWNGAVSMCWICRASGSIANLLWSDFRKTAGWRQTRWTHESYMRHLRESSMFVPVLLACVVGLRLECIMVDVLHTVDLGIASHIIANVFWLLAVKRFVFGRGTQGDNIKKLFEHMNEWYKTIKHKTKLQGKLTVERIRTKAGWPKLKAKAAQTRCLSRYALELMQKFGDKSDHDRKVTAVCQLLVRFYDLMDAESMFLGESARKEMPNIGFRLGTLYSDLAAQAAAIGEKMWKTSPKLHIFVHLCEWQCLEFGNPRYYWCYADEDLVGSMIEIGETCHPRTIAASCLFKWLHLAFE